MQSIINLSQKDIYKGALGTICHIFSPTIYEVTKQPSNGPNTYISKNVAIKP
jgi:hypothetical protein